MNPNSDRPNQSVYHPGQTKREVVLDMLRGIAIISMIVTHAIAFFHVGEDPLINNLGLIGGTISFGLFLFISGAANYLSFVQYDSVADSTLLARRRRGILYRSISLLIGYYLIATIAFIPKYSFPPNTTWIENIARTLFFVDVPEFAEFIIPLVIFSLLVIPLRRFYRFGLRYVPFLILFGLFAYALGTLLHPVELTGFTQSLKSLIVGEGEWHRFPILQYWIVYILGLAWGKFLSRYASTSYRTKIALLSSAATLILAVVGSVTFDYLGFSWLEPLHRWPPSLTFMLWGLLASYVVFLVLNLTNYLRLLGPGQVFIHYLGTQALNYFVGHTVILYIYKFATEDKHHESAIVVTILFVALMLGTTFFSIIKEWLIKNLKEEAGVTEGFGWLFSERVLVIGIWMMLFFLGGMAAYQGNHVDAAVSPDSVSFKKRLIREQDWPYWWDHSFNFFQQIFINNDNPANPIGRNTWFSVGFDHATAVAAGQSLASGADVRVVYFDDQDGFIELPFVFEGIGGKSTLKFKLENDIQASTKDDKYFIYYGNTASAAYPASKDQPAATLSAGVSTSEIFKHRMSGTTNRKWLLKGGTVSLQLRTLLYTVQLDSSISPDSLVSYSIEGTTLRGMMDDKGAGKFEAAIKISDLPAGTYQVQAVAREKENKLKIIESGYTNFYVTYPLYVVWTQDWEGWDVPDAWLNELDAFARRFNMPMTHFFNPCIFVPSCTNATRAPVKDKNRADQLTLWMIDRARRYNDEVGLHLHMFPALAVAAGVTPKYSTVPWLYGDAPTYAYSKDEMKQILNWSRRTFQDNGLPSPISFRAGGWMAKENTLASLEESGFLIDSSGRGGPAPGQSSLPPPWNLPPTVKPYRPNTTDINSSAAPQMNVWEFPNNGADSIWYNEVELIKRFDLNYPNKGTVLTEPQVVVYLSHPPFWPIDRPRVEKLFSYVNNFMYRNDAGPVVYDTLSSVYYSWDRTK